MDAELFLKLKEYDSLLKMRINHLKAKSEQDDRLSTLKKRFEEDFLRTEKLNHEQKEKRQELHILEQNLKTLQQQKERLQDIGADEAKISSYQQQIDQAEELGLGLLTLMEEQEQAVQDLRQFLEGLKKTTLEIEGEAEIIKNQEEVAITNIDLRLKHLEEELPENYRDTLKKTLKKNLAIGPFTRIEASSCMFCRYRLSRIDESEIDAHRQLRVCPQCCRIFLPAGT